MSVVSSSVFLSAPPDTENQDIPGLTCVSQSSVTWVFFLPGSSPKSVPAKDKLHMTAGKANI